MSIVIKNHTRLVILIFFCLRMDHFGQSASMETILESKSKQPTEAESNQINKNLIYRENVATNGEEVIQTQPSQPWTIVPTYSWSFFNKGRDSWQKESIDLYYHPKKYLLLGTSIDLTQRPPTGDDIMYSFNASWYPCKELELHGEISHTPDPIFSPNEIYSVGFEYMLNAQVSLLFDLERLNYNSNDIAYEDDITQISPGISYWFTEKSFITMRYTHGWVHSETDFDYYSAAVTLGNMPYNAQLTLGFAYGTDPDLDFGSGVTTLSNAYTLSIYYKQPINPDLSVFAGLEYVYRMRPDNDGQLYQKLTPTIGLSWKF